MFMLEEHIYAISYRWVIYMLSHVHVGGKFNNELAVTFKSCDPVVWAHLDACHIQEKVGSKGWPNIGTN